MQLWTAVCRGFDALAAIGHLGGVVEVGKLHLRVAQRGDPFWRCQSCERIHLHRGEQICTRCYTPLPDNPTGAVDTLWSTNFLGRRIVRGHDQGIKRFRLKCEELSGQQRISLTAFDGSRTSSSASPTKSAASRKRSTCFR